MSVINQMLKELDERSNRSNNQSAMPNIPSYVATEKNSLLKVIAIIVAVVVIATAIYFSMFSGNKAATESQPMPLVAPVSEVTEKKQAVNQAEPEDIKVAEPISIETKTIKKEQVEDSVESLPLSTPLVQEPALDVKPIELKRVVKSERPPDTKAQADRLYQSARRKLESKQYADAKQLLQQATAVFSEHHQARLLLFSILLQQQQVATLEQQLKQSLEKWPEVAEYRQVQARLLMQQQQNTAALELLTRDIPSVNIAPDYHALLAYVAQQTANDKLASKHYQLLLKQQPSRADWWLGLAVSEEKLANKSSALQAYQYAVSRPGLSQNVRQYAQQRIKVLQGF